MHKDILASVILVEQVILSKKIKDQFDEIFGTSN